MITITLMGTPIAKARARVGKFGAYTPKQSKHYSDALAWAAKIAMKGKPPLDGALNVLVWCYMPIPKTSKAKQGDWHLVKPDLDNIIKQLDALNGIVWKDDSKIAALTSTKSYSKEPRLVINVEIMK
jgi:Holliday junction resolvase RusA-like endonuclease